MVEPKHVRPREEPSAPAQAAEHPLAALATALEPYGVRYRYVEDKVPCLRVGNLDSRYAVEDIRCESRTRGHAFLSSYGVCMGTSDDISGAAERVAWLVGATAF